MKYKILYDYRSDGFTFEDEEFDTVAGAVKHAMESNYNPSFLIVQIIDWEAVEKR